LLRFAARTINEAMLLRTVTRVGARGSTSMR
jgi:hypothetical protein